jgi:hypothetical protein
MAVENTLAYYNTEAIEMILVGKESEVAFLYSNIVTGSSFANVYGPW